VGGSYKSTARGLPDPGPGAVEVSAEGDLDGDGRTGLIVMVGKVDPATRQLVFPQQLTLSNHKE
jgi:hypothetical protein